MPAITAHQDLNTIHHPATNLLIYYQICLELCALRPRKDLLFCLLVIDLNVVVAEDKTISFLGPNHRDVVAPCERIALMGHNAVQLVR